MALDKPMSELNESDLDSLIAAGTPELKTLEYKLSLPGRSESDRKEFFADVSSFANSAGGHIVYGMRADAGIPLESVGVDEDGDPAILSLESAIRDGIVPRIAGIHTTAIKLAKTGKTAIVMHIPKSFAAPHMVQYKGSSRFYARTSNGKYQLDVHEIRAAMLGSETTAQRIRDFRLDRIAQIRARETPVPLPAGPSISLHLIPVNAIASTRNYDLVRLKSNSSIHQTLAPLFWSFVNNSRLNLDGLLLYNINKDQISPAFTQVYRTGIIESADTLFFKSPEQFGRGKILPSEAFEKGLLTSVQRYLSTLKSLEVDLPLLVTVSLLDVKGYALSLDYAQTDEFDREIISAQEIMIESYDVNITSVMKPLLDQIWNAAGRAGSPYYSGDTWTGRLQPS
jgi:hypothetical protein